MTGLVKLKLMFGPFGPHAGKWMFLHKNKWHFYRWASKAELYESPKTKQINISVKE